VSEDETYSDRWIECSSSGVQIRGYYFPWGAKHIAYEKIRSVRRVGTSALRGQWRIWGTANLKYWASFDPKRPSKHVAFTLDLGHRVQPFVTPEDPDSFERVLKARSTATWEEDRSPLI
jgi:hypothetical protein